MVSNVDSYESVYSMHCNGLDFSPRIVLMTHLEFEYRMVSKLLVLLRPPNLKCGCTNSFVFVFMPPDLCVHPFSMMKHLSQSGQCCGASRKTPYRMKVYVNKYNGCQYFFDSNYRESPVSAVFWSPANCTIVKTALIGE